MYQIWSDLNKWIGFYTKENAAEIPDTAGVYGWLLPLWLYDDYDLKSFMNLYMRFFDYEPPKDQDTGLTGTH